MKYKNIIILKMVLIIILQNSNNFINGQELFVKHNIDLNFLGACSVCSYDVDGDGNLDIIGAANAGNQVAWWKNDGNEPIGFTKYSIDSNINGIMYVDAGDVDNDGDLDILGAAWQGEMVAVWINEGGDPIIWEKSIIDGNIGMVHEVHAEDINKDGLLDVIAASGSDNSIEWYENNGGPPNTWEKFIVDNQFSAARSVKSFDINNDGHIDLIGAGLMAHQICIWLNDGNSPINWTKQIIDNSFKGAHWVHLEDIDKDGNMDILGAAFIDDEIAWWRNDGNSPIQWEKQAIAPLFNAAISVSAGDVDGDGDIDIFGGGRNPGRIYWWSNDGGEPIQWTSNVIANNYFGAWPVFGVDLDVDGDLDILTTGDVSNDVHWWENTTLSKLGTDDNKNYFEIISLSNNYPNPFNPITKIDYYLPISEKINISVFNTLGNKVEELFNGYQEAGQHDLIFTGKNLPSGFYYYMLKSSRNSKVKKCLLLK